MYQSHLCAGKKPQRRSLPSSLDKEFQSILLTDPFMLISVAIKKGNCLKRKNKKHNSFCFFKIILLYRSRCRLLSPLQTRKRSRSNRFKSSVIYCFRVIWYPGRIAGNETRNPAEYFRDAVLKDAAGQAACEAQAERKLLKTGQSYSVCSCFLFVP